MVTNDLSTPYLDHLCFFSRRRYSWRHGGSPNTSPLPQHRNTHYYKHYDEIKQKTQGDLVKRSIFSIFRVDPFSEVDEQTFNRLSFPERVSIFPSSFDQSKVLKLNGLFLQNIGLNIFISINSTYIHTILRISNGIQKEAKRLIRICFPI